MVEVGRERAVKRGALGHPVVRAGAIVVVDTSRVERMGVTRGRSYRLSGTHLCRISGRRDALAAGSSGGWSDIVGHS